MSVTNTGNSHGRLSQLTSDSKFINTRFFIRTTFIRNTRLRLGQKNKNKLRNKAGCDSKNS